MVADAALQALAMYQGITRPDPDQEGGVQRAERALIELLPKILGLLGGAQAMHGWLNRGEFRAPMRAALVLH